MAVNLSSVFFKISQRAISVAIKIPRGAGQAAHGEVIKLKCSFTVDKDLLHDKIYTVVGFF